MKAPPYPTVLLLLLLAWIGPDLSLPALGQSGQRRPPSTERWPNDPPQNPNSQRPQSSSSGKKEKVSDQGGIVELRADLVTVTATVTGSRGELIGNIAKDDFEVSEDGKPQAIATFARSEVPLTMVILFDASLSVRTRLEFERQAVVKFLRTTLRPVDRVGIISVSTDIIWRQDLTNNLEQLTAASRAIFAEGATALYDAVNEAATRLSSAE